MLFPDKVLQQRLRKIQRKIEEQDLDALLVSSQANRFYLSGFRGDEESGYLLITTKKAFLLTDSRYTEEAVNEAAGFEIKEYGSNEKFWKNLFSENKLTRVGFETKNLSVFDLNRLKKLTKKSFIPTTDFVEEFRAVKDQEELVFMKKAASICDAVFKEVLKNIKPFQTERQVAWEMEKMMREKGAEKNAWDPFIVASGPNSSKVHYAAGERSIKKGDQVLLDWGVYFEGYASDISRVIFIDAPNKKQAEVYELVLKAQEKGAKEILVNGETMRVDKVAREFLEERSDFVFGHAVGHGVGLEVHELPHVNIKTKERFKVGNVITVEPGIYEPGWGGVRLEDMLAVTEEGFEVLTKSPKALKEVIV